MKDGTACNRTNCCTSEKVPDIMACDAMTAAKMAKTKVIHQRGDPVPPGIELKKTFGMTASPFVIKAAP